MDIVKDICPNCGAALRFDAEKQIVLCDYCMSEFSPDDIAEAVESAKMQDTSDNSAEEREEFAGHSSLFICDSCGAEIISDENTAATFCHYCHSPVTLSGRISGDFAPESVLPFKLSRADAEGAFHKWCSKKWFLPSKFKTDKTLEKMTGLYVPFWLADCGVNAMINCEGKIVHSYISGGYRITNTKVYNVERAAKMEYSGVPADGSKKLDDDFMGALEPFDYSQMRPFSHSFLSGFFADKYDNGKADVLPGIKGRIEQSAVETLKSGITGYTSLSIKSKNVNIKNTLWHYVMLPVWFMTYKHDGKDYFFALNGQSGKVSGIPPVSKAKTAVFASLLFVLAGIIGMLLGGQI